MRGVSALSLFLFKKLAIDQLNRPEPVAHYLCNRAPWLRRRRRRQQQQQLCVGSSSDKKEKILETKIK